MWRELRTSAEAGQAAGTKDNMNADRAITAPNKTFMQAAKLIVVAVAGAAREHQVILIFGLGMSIVLMRIPSVVPAQGTHQTPIEQASPTMQEALCNIVFPLARRRR